MFDEQPKRRPRTPLTKEEIFYFKKIKELQYIEKIQLFKKSKFYIFFNKANIILSSLLAYYLFSALFACNWQTDTIAQVRVQRGSFDFEKQERTISELDIETITGNQFDVSTNSLYEAPKVGESVFIGTDYIFKKHIKTKFLTNNKVFWNRNTYPSFFLCCVSLLLGFFIYKVNKHLSHNGLLMAFGLFFVSCLYFLLV